MKNPVQTISAFGTWLLIIAAIAQNAFGGWPPGSGLDIVGTAVSPHYMVTCGIKSVNGEFLVSESRYHIEGTCAVFLDQNPAGQSTFDNQKLQYQFQWSAVGTFNPTTKNTAEQISLIQMRSGRPDNPPLPTEIAKIVTTMVCAQDPWREPAGLACGSLRPQILGNLDDLNPNKIVKTDAVLPPSNTSSAAVMAALYNPKGRAVPATSWLLSDQRAHLQKQYADYVLAAQRRSQEIRQATPQQGVISQIIFPSILSPTRGQSFYAQRPVPIKLAPPQGWNVTSYMVNIEINGYPCNLPVGAAQAQSAGGYTGFGAGKPPCFLAIPGAYRLRAQVDSPRQSGWSDWVDFTVAPSKATAPAGMIKK